jgi:SAM-dependent methyltransferase
MSNKKFFKKGEADEWFLRNKKGLEQKQNNEDISLLCGWLEPFKKNINDVVELGCGSGHKLNSLVEGTGAKGFGVEPSQKAVEYISQKFPSLTAKVGFADAVPFSQTFDLVHLGFFLYLVDRDKYFRCISEADRLVKFGGFLSIIRFRNTISIFKRIFTPKWYVFT